MGRRKNRGRGKEDAPAAEDLALNQNTDDNDNVNSTEVSLRGELLLEVLSRLDPPTLFRAKCVSKGFRSYIGNPELGAHHYRTCKSIVGKGLTGIFSHEGIYLPVEPDVGGIPDPKLKFLDQTCGTGCFDLIDSCNGLLFGIFEEQGKQTRTFFVCNPLTKETIILPPPKKPSQGVGYALAADLDGLHLRYKVLCLNPKKNGDSQLSVFSSETGEWSKVSDDLPSVSFDFENSSRVFCKGSLYWDSIDGHILVFRVNTPANNRPCYELIEAPKAVPNRCLWKSDDELYCYCHGVEPESAEWTLGIRRGKPAWKNVSDDCVRLGNLSDDILSYQSVEVTDQLDKIATKEFQIISYTPESDTLFLLVQRKLFEVYAYRCSERSTRDIGFYQSDRNIPWWRYDGWVQYGSHKKERSFQQREPRALPYTHSMARIQIAKPAINTIEEEVSEKVRGRRNRRTPRCSDFSIDD